MTGPALARIGVARSDVTGNTLYAIEPHGASSILSRDDNTVIDNAGAETTTGTYLPK